MSNNAVDPPDTSPVDLLSGDADVELAAAATNTESFTIDDDDDNNKSEADDVVSPLQNRSPSSGSQKPSKSGAKMAKLSDKTSKIMNDYQAYLQEIETEFPSESVIAEANVNQVKDSIRAGYQDKFTPPPTNLASMTKEYNPPSDTPLRRGWDHGDDEEEGSLNMRDHLVTRRKYTHPLLHSKRLKKALCMTLAVTAAVVIGVSVSSNKKEKNAPDWEGEYEEIDGGEGKASQQQENPKPYVNDKGYQESMSYQMSATTYQPHFFNRANDSDYPDGSYREAWQFCASTEGYGLCPFAAVCPNGPGSNPIRGVQAGGPSWNPVSDRVDEWVQIAADGKCSLYSQHDATPPKWGVMGGNDDATRNMFCCKQVDTGVVPTMTSTGVETSATPLAIEFDRSKDWTGQTYGQAADFCGQKGYTICPLEVLCPDGMNHAPSTGIKPGPDGQWAPIDDRIHDWVQVGADIPCTTWLGRHPDPPVWSQNGVGNEEITRYIYCCPGSVYSVAKPTATSDITTTISTTKLPVHLEITPDESNAAAVVQAEAPPRIQWFDRSTGWKGQTYAAAYNFCMEAANALPCEYSDICPSGQGAIPDGGFRASSESWAPIKESADLEDDNAWVSVSAENACTRYDRLHAAPPVWGETGEGNEEITRNVACCHETLPPTNQVRYLCIVIEVYRVIRFWTNIFSFSFTLYSPHQIQLSNPHHNRQTRQNRHPARHQSPWIISSLQSNSSILFGLIGVRDGLVKLTPQRCNFVVPNRVSCALHLPFVLNSRRQKIFRLVVSRKA